FFFFQAEDGIRDKLVTGVQTCALPIWRARGGTAPGDRPRCTGRRRRDGAPRPRSARSGTPRSAGRGTACPRARRSAWRSRACREIGRASCRERGEIVGGGGEVKEKQTK